MASQTAPTIQESATVSVSEAEFLKQPAVAFAELSRGNRVQVVASDGSPRMIIFPGTIADFPETD